MKRKIFKVSLILLILAVTFIIISMALVRDGEDELMWGPDGLLITNIISLPYESPQLISAGEEEFYIIWINRYPENGRNENSNIFAQRVDMNGIKLWPEEGITLCSNIGKYGYIQSIPDGSRGFITVFQNFCNNNTDIYAQRIDKEGNKLWGDNGVPICTEAHNQLDPQLTTDGNNGAIITWQDYRNGVDNPDIYAQHIDKDGILKWQESGIAICNRTTIQGMPAIASDGLNGAFIAWSEGRRSLYVQRLNIDSGKLWEVKITEACMQVVGAKITSDNQNGIIVAWEKENLIEHKIQVYAQKIDKDGIKKWRGEGLSIVDNNRSFSYHPLLVSDGLGGAIFMYLVGISHQPRGIYTNHINERGEKDWMDFSYNGAQIFSVSSFPIRQGYITTDNKGGAVIAWDRNENENNKVRIQHVDINGHFSFNADNGLSICNINANQTNPSVLSYTDSNNKCKTIIVWKDKRDYSTEQGDYNYDIYAQRVDFQLNAPPVADSQILAVNEDTALSITLTGMDPDGDPISFSVWRTPTHGTLRGYAPNLTYKPNRNYFGSDSFKFYTMDSNFFISPLGTIAITVNPVNDGPKFLNIPSNITIFAERQYSFTAKAEDPDTSNLEFSAENLPQGASFRKTGPKEATFSWQPRRNQTSNYRIVFKVKDKQYTDKRTMLLTVKPKPRAIN